MHIYVYDYMMYNIIYMYIKCVCKLCCFGKRLRLYGKNYWEPFSPLRYTAGDNCQKWRPTMRSMATWRQKPEFGASWTLFFFINKSSLIQCESSIFLMFNMFNQKRPKTWFASLCCPCLVKSPSFSFLFSRKALQRCAWHLWLVAACLVVVIWRRWQRTRNVERGNEYLGGDWGV